jgi:SAM-dependent methyltransferase
LDRLDFEHRHPARGAADAGTAIPGLAEQTVLPRDAAPRQWPCPDPIGAEEVRAAWNRNAERWDAGYDHDGDETRRYLSDESLLRMLGEVTDRTVLDLGCGNGYLCRKLAHAGGRVTGVDLSDEMLANAEGYERAKPHGIRYLRSSITDLSALPDESFDAVVSNYVLQDLLEYDKAVHEAYRVLRPGGHVVLVITHPCFSCGPREWHVRAPDSPRPEESIFFAVDHYFREGAYLLDAWDGFTPVPYFHRPLRAYWRTFRATGFEVDNFDEPSLNERGQAELPAWRAAQVDRIPLACVFRLSKPTRSR